MKKLHTNSISRLAAGVLLTLGIVFATGCAKDAKQDVGEYTGEGTRLVVRVEGIDNGSSKPLLKGSSEGKKSGSITNGHAKLVEGDGFDVFVSQTNKIVSGENLANTMRSSSSKSAKGLRSEAMANGISYRLFLRKTGETTLISEPFVSGTTGSIAVEKGASYEWFALSFNTTDEVAAGTDGSVTITDHSGVLYAKGTFEVGTGDGDVVVPLNITFKPQLTRIAVEINTMGMFAPIASADVSVTGGYATPDAIDVVTGNFLGTVAPINVAYSDFIEVVSGQGDRKVAYVNVAANSSEDISVKVTNLKITLDDGSERNFGSSTMTQTFTPEPGMEQQIVLGFVESPLTHAGVQWSRSPLYYAGNRSATSVAQLEHNPYRFYHTNPALTSNNPEAYFSYGGAMPGKLAKQANPLDPCAFVYPAGLWKTPSSGDLAGIKSYGVTTLLEVLNLNVGGTLDALVGVLDLLAAPVEGASLASNPNAHQFTSVTGGANSAYASTPRANTLRFNYNGFMRDVDLVEGLIQLQLGNTVGSYSAFWTNDRSFSLPFDIANLGVLHYLGHTHTVTVPILGTVLSTEPKAFEGANVLAVDVLGLDLVRSSLMNVRCVRNSGWNPNAAGYDPNPDYSVIFN